MKKCSFFNAYPLMTGLAVDQVMIKDNIFLYYRNN
ncbi:hypothetical protein SAMN05216378_2035 [Paenibacillus catalpae]|uniref:Uncharacterized protein n=1 Tax=Paenibacillus catalpae TaxID=1045775 RepID=A0A1I1XCE7_9BACL|nr:hypothetical protein SAMN05216378_2035 [Paenibacillus catalpae]